MCNLCSLTHPVHLHLDYFNSEVEDVVSTETSVPAKTTRYNNPEEDKVNTNRCEKLIFLILFLFTKVIRVMIDIRTPSYREREQSQCENKTLWSGIGLSRLYHVGYISSLPAMSVGFQPALGVSAMLLFLSN